MAVHVVGMLLNVNKMAHVTIGPRGISLYLHIKELSKKLLSEKQVLQHHRPPSHKAKARVSAERWQYSHMAQS